MRIRVSGWTLGLLAVLIPARAQEPYVMVFAEPQLRGDVRFLLAPSGFPAPPDLVGILRESLGCEWRPILVTPRVAQGTCRRLLHPQGGAVHDTLQLAPLGAALRRAGAETINFSLAAQGESLGGQRHDWTRGEVGQTADSGRMAAITNWSFHCEAGDALPPAFEAEVGGGWSYQRVIAPFVLVLTVPFVLACWVRRRMLRTGAGSGSAGIWLTWILLGSWLYWITTVRLQDLVGFTSALDTDLWLLSLTLGAVLFCGPPLASTALCALALGPALDGEETGRSASLLRGVLTGEAKFVVPLGLFLTGTALLSQEFKAGLASILMAYGAFRIFSYFEWRETFRDRVRVASGALYDRAAEIAAAAGAPRPVLYLIETRSPLEANAFASPGGVISITRSLVERLSRREVDTILGHEIGHAGGNSSWWQLPLLLFYLFVGGPALVRYAAQAGVPEWVMELPLIPLLYVMATGWISQKQELLADARAVALTKDPEAGIAALAKLAQITKSPVDWKGMQGSILSHPSMKKRVLALAKRSGVKPRRALELLHDPDALLPEGAEKEYYELPEEAAERAMVFTSAARTAFLYWGNWVFGGALIGLVALVWAATMGTAAGLTPRAATAVRIGWLTAALPLVAAAALRIDEEYSRWFLRGLRRRLEAKRAPRPGGIFVGMMPGERVRASEGFHVWDLGHLYLEDDGLRFEGERVQFAVGAAEVDGVTVVAGRFAWFRPHAAVVRAGTAVFNLQMPDRGASRRAARELTERILAWKAGAGGAAGAAEEEVRLPRVVEASFGTPQRVRVAWFFAKTAALIAIGAWLTTTIAVGYAYSTPVVAWSAAMVYLIAVGPGVVRREGVRSQE